MWLGVQWLLPLLLLLVLLDAGGYEGILFGEAADDAGSDFVGGCLVFSGNIDSEFLL
jgi:hypothetical protein